MATYTDSLGFNKGSSTFHEKGLHRTNMVSVTLDIDNIVAARLAAGATALAATDTLAVIPLQAKTYVIVGGVDITTASGVTSTIDIGDGTDVDGYIDGADCTSVASAAKATGYTAGKYYATADTIDVLFNTAIPNGAVIRVWALVADCR